MTSAPPVSNLFQLPERLRKFDAFLPILNAESPRGAVLIAAAYIDEQLKDVIRSFLVDGEDAKKLFDGVNAPVGSFSARIAAAAAMGLIAESERDDCNIIRRVRNEFAHQVDANFDDQKIIGLCKQLKASVPGERGDMTAGQVAHGDLITAAASLILRFTNRSTHVASERRAMKEWPF